MLDIPYLQKLCPIDDFITEHKFIVLTEIPNWKTLGLRFKVGDLTTAGLPTEALKKTGNFPDDEKLCKSAMELLRSKIALTLSKLSLVVRTCNDIITAFLNKADSSHIMGFIDILANLLDSLNISDKYFQKWNDFLKECQNQLDAI
jgi:hypothetical protein